MRKPRFTYIGAFHHVMNRGLEGRPIFSSNVEKDYFIFLIKKYAILYKINILAYVVMDNHYHIILQNSSGKLSNFMRQINSSYALYWRKRHGGRGYVFQDRYKSTLINGEKYLYISKDPKDSKHTFPVIPGWITAHARMKLLREMKKREKYVVYCDTDSIHILSSCPNPIEPSKELGGWGFEYEREQIYYRPKFYAEKRKGVPKRAVKKEEKEDHEVYEYDTPVKRATAIRRGLTQNLWIKIVKTITKEDDKRVWNGNESVPIKL